MKNIYKAFTDFQDKVNHTLDAIQNALMKTEIEQLERIFVEKFYGNWNNFMKTKVDQNPDATYEIRTYTYDPCTLELWRDDTLIGRHTYKFDNETSTLKWTIEDLESK